MTRNLFGLILSLVSQSASPDSQTSNCTENFVDKYFSGLELCWRVYKSCVTQVHDSGGLHAGQIYCFAVFCHVATEWLLQRYEAFFCWIKIDGAEMCQAVVGDGAAFFGNRDVAVVF